MASTPSAKAGRVVAWIVIAALFFAAMVIGYAITPGPLTGLAAGLCLFVLFFYGLYWLAIKTSERRNRR